MKRFVTFCLLAFAAVFLLTNQTLAQSFTPVDGPGGVPGFKFTGLPEVYVEGELAYFYFVQTTPVVPIVNQDNSTVLGSGSGYAVAGLGGELTIYIPPQASGSVTVAVKGDIDGSGDLSTIISGTRSFSGPAKVPSSIVLVSSGNPAPYGDKVFFTATVSGSGGTPTGNVTLKEGIDVIGSGSLTGGVVTIEKEGLPVGTHSLTASYSGDGAYDPSSTPFSQGISQKTLFVVGITASDKIYDGNATATLAIPSNPLDGIFGGENVVLNPGVVGAFSNKNVGQSKTVTITGLSLGGTAAGNYVLSTAAVTTTASITVKVITVTGVTASDKVYDGNTVASLNTNSAVLVGVVSDDVVNVPPGQGNGTFDSKNVGTSKNVIVAGMKIVGTDADNYLLTQPTASASISKAPASVTPLAASKVYGTADPVLVGTLSGFVTSDNITANYSRIAGETVAGSPYTISATLSPTAALDNYDITYGTAAFTITKANASVTPNAANKLYGTADPTFTGTLTGFVPLDNVTATYSRTAGETVGSYVISATLSPSGLLPNYNITYGTATFTIAKNASSTVVTSTVNPAVYGQTVALTATVSGAGTPTGSVVFMDGTTELGTVSLNGSGVATLSNAALSVAGSPHTITVTYAGDVNFAGSTSAPLAQAITPATLTAVFTANNKPYDGTVSATIATRSLTGILNLDDVTLTGGTATFADKKAGNGKTVTATGFALGGSKASNYVLASTSATTTANITTRALLVSATGVNKVYDGTTTATVTLSDNRVSGDDFTDSYASATFSDPNVGTGKTVTVTGISISGTDATNYLANTTATTTADITAATTNTGAIAGAGWISSPAGAYVKSPTATGRGYFAFAAGYTSKNPVTPTGIVEFQLKTKGLFYPSIMSLSSTQFESLVVSGSQATLKGNGSVNGASGFGFLLSVIDGQGFTGNKLRIKVWDKNHANAVVYDNQMGAADDANPTGAVTGLLSVSKSAGSTTAADVSVQQLIEEDAATEMPTQYELYNAYPNPFNPSTTIKFDLPEASKIRLAVYDMLGREVAVLADGERPAGQYSVRFDAAKLSSGIYICRLQSDHFTQTKKLMLMK
jgi:hypothetical protein